MLGKDIKNKWSKMMHVVVYRLSELPVGSWTRQQQSAPLHFSPLRSVYRLAVHSDLFTPVPEKWERLDLTPGIGDRYSSSPFSWTQKILIHSSAHRLCAEKKKTVSGSSRRWKRVRAGVARGESPRLSCGLPDLPELEPRGSRLEPEAADVGSLLSGQ